MIGFPLLQDCKGKDSLNIQLNFLCLKQFHITKDENETCSHLPGKGFPTFFLFHFHTTKQINP